MSVSLPRVPVVDSRIHLDRRLLAATTSCAPPKADPQSPPKLLPLAVAGVLAVALTWWVWAAHGPRLGIVAILGLLLGVALFHARFGFTASWRQFVAVGNGAGLRAQALLLATAATMIALIAGTGLGAFGTTPQTSAYPLGIPLVAGAILFGLGMQLAGSCASGTLFAVGAGQSTILLTLVSFVAGTTVYTWAYPVLGHLPQAPGILLADHIGWFGSWAVTMALLGGFTLLTLWVQRRRNPPPAKPEPTAHGIVRLYRGTWPMLLGGAVLGVLAGLVFLFGGGIWRVINGFTLWGAKILELFGVHPQHWAYWEVGANAKQLAAPVLTDPTSLTDFGIMIGAALACAAAGAWYLRSRVPAGTAIAAILGGLAMGLGGKMSGGCNIGAFIGGISQGSVSGWIWAAAALTGTWVGMRLRPYFGLVNPKSADGVC